MLITWFDSIEDYQSQIASAKQVFYSTIHQSSIGGTTYLSTRTIQMIEEELEQHEQFLRMLCLLKAFGLEHLTDFTKRR